MCDHDITGGLHRHNSQRGSLWRYFVQYFSVAIVIECSQIIKTAFPIWVNNIPCSVEWESCGFIEFWECNLRLYMEKIGSESAMGSDRYHIMDNYPITLWKHYGLNLLIVICFKHFTASHHNHNVWVRLSIFSQLSLIQYMGLCVFSLPISLVMIERIYTLSYYHHPIGSMNYHPLFRVRSWNNNMYCMSLYILIYIAHNAIFAY